MASSKPASHIRGGVHPKHRKNTAESRSAVMPVPPQVAVPMQQHIGAPCTPCVAKGDKVFVGTLLGDSDNFVSAPIYSGVSGEVASVGEVTLSSGATAQAVIINTDGEQTADEHIAPPTVTNREEFLSAVRKSGLVGLGGAGFPTHIKLNPKQKVDTLVVNAAECEPYITADYREMMENTSDIIDGISLVIKYIGVKSVVIVVENNKPKAVERLDAAIRQNGLSKTVRVLSTAAKYPRGAEKITVYAATGRKIAPGQLPADAGCIVMNVSSVATVARYINTGMPLCSKRITVDGSAVTNPMNVIAPVGTYIKDIIEFAGGYKCEPKKIILGGPMMGFALPDDDTVIVKQTNAILALNEAEAYPKPLSACIRCGRCVRVCPMSLLPAKIETHLKTGDTDALKKDGVMNCIECGCCAFECPAARPLVQVMRQSKALLKNK